MPPTIEHRARVTPGAGWKKLYDALTRMSLTQHTRAWLLVFVLLGLGSSAASLSGQYRTERAPVGSSVDASSQTFNCDIVYRNRFATYRGVPLALGGAIWFTLALLLTPGVRVNSHPGQTDTAAYLFLMSIPALSAALFFSYVSIVVLNAVCIWCVLTYVAVLGIFVVSAMITNTPLAGLPRQIVRDARALVARPLAFGLAIVFVTAAVAAVAFFPRAVNEPTAALAAALAQQPNEFDLWFESQGRARDLLPADGARVLIVKFNDYLCPECAETYKTAGPVIAKYQQALPGEVRLVVRDFPQDPECNPNAGAVFHEAGCEAAVAVRLAERHQRGATLAEWLYTHRAGLTPAAVRQAAKEIGQVSDFDEEYARTIAAITSDVDEGHRLGVTAPPTFFINGVRIEGALKPAILDQAIAHELRVTAAK
jgi:uncharacterized membrane protein/predicted DsbA family dithiol-disulfide isomerase